MSYTTLVTDTTWGSGPTIYLSIAYDYKRDGASMLYKIKVYDIKLQYSNSYFGYPIYGKVYLNGSSTASASTTIKNASPSQWSSLSWETDWLTVSNKTTGSTALTVTIYSGSGESRTQNYSYTLPIIAAAVKIKSLSSTSIYENDTITVTPDDNPGGYDLNYCISKDGSSADITPYGTSQGLTLINKDILYKAIPNATSFKPYVYLRTQSNGTTIGYDKQQITVTLIPKNPEIRITGVTNGIDINKLNPEYIKMGNKTYIYTYNFIPVVSYDYTIYNYGTCKSITINGGSASISTKQYALNSIPSSNQITAQVVDSRGWQSGTIINQDYIFINDYFIPTFYWSENPTFTITTFEGRDTISIKGKLEFSIPNKWNGNNIEGRSFKYIVYGSDNPEEILEFGDITGAQIETEGNIEYNPGITYTIKIIYQDNILTNPLTSNYSGNPKPIFDFGVNDFNFNVPVNVNGDATITGTVDAYAYNGINSMGNITFNGGEQTRERNINFKNINGANPHNCQLYGGNPTSATGIGMWDAQNSRRILSYTDSDNKLYLGSDDGSCGTILYGSLTLGGHNTPVGSIKSGTSTTKEVTKNSTTNLTSVTLPSGVWILLGGVYTASLSTSGSNGVLRVTLGDTSTSDNLNPANNNGYGTVGARAYGSSLPMYKEVVTIRDGEGTVYLNVVHNIQDKLTMTGQIRAIRIV